MNKPKISVIVAVYNTEKYLEKCLDSLINQTYNNIEIIVVEDCSIDKSKDLLQKYTNNSKIKIIYNNQNRGLSYARNVGIKESTGSYIGFIDSDDYVDLNYYENLMTAIQNKKADIAICDIKVVTNGTELISKCYSGNNFNLLNVINTGLAASACNKLFKKDIINKYKFAEGKINEDIAVVIPALVNAKKIAYAADTYYYYIQRGGSIQNSGFSDKRFDIFYGVSTTLERIKKHKKYKELEEALVYNQLIVLLIYVIPKEKNILKRRKILKRFNELSSKYQIRQNHFYWDFLVSCGKKHRIYYKMLFKLNCNHLYLLSSLLIFIYDAVKTIFKEKNVIKKDINMQDLINLAISQNQKAIPKIKVSVIVPNYNYSKYMYQRIYSILNQTYKIYELIILDDCSKDNSRELLDKIAKKLKKYINIKIIYNEQNSGSAFKQWKKGMDNATGDYVWIAEADDYCEPKLISSLIKPCLQNPNIIISYSDTAFINADGNIIMKSVIPEIDIQKTNHWRKNYVNNGLNEVENYSFLNCTVANVSSTIIKNGKYDKYLSISGDYRQAGDWLFYINLMKNGDVAFNHKVLNYYRLHGNNVSATMNHKNHIEEIKNIHKYILNEFNLSKKHRLTMQKRINFLKKSWHIKN